MTKRSKLLLKYLFLFLFGGTIYCLIELLFRGHTHPSMYILGGICFIICGLYNEILSWDTPLILQMFLSATSITILEFITGVIVNIILKLNVWDYSNMPFNLFGQICLPFYFAWFFLSAVAIIVDDYIRYYFFGEEKPRYKIF